MIQFKYKIKFVIIRGNIMAEFLAWGASAFVSGAAAGISSLAATAVSYGAPLAYKAFGNYRQLSYMNHVYKHEVDTTAKMAGEIFGPAGETLGKALGHIAGAPVVFNPANKRVAEWVNVASKKGAEVVFEEFKGPILEALKPKAGKTGTKEENVLAEDGNGTCVRTGKILSDDTPSDWSVIDKVVEEEIKAAESEEEAKPAAPKKDAEGTSKKIDNLRVVLGLLSLGGVAAGAELAAATSPYFNLAMALPTLLETAQAGFSIFNKKADEEVKLTPEEIALFRDFVKKFETLTLEQRTEFFEALDRQYRKEAREAKKAQMVSTAEVIGKVVLPSVIGGAAKIVSDHAKLKAVNTAYEMTVEAGRSAGDHLFNYGDGYISSGFRWVGSKIGAGLGHMGGASVALSEENMKIAEAAAKLAEDGTNVVLTGAAKKVQDAGYESTILKTTACAGVLIAGVIALYAAPVVVLGTLTGNILGNYSLVSRYVSSFSADATVDEEPAHKEFSRETMSLLSKFNKLNPKLSTEAKAKVVDKYYADDFINDFEEVQVIVEQKTIEDSFVKVEVTVEEVISTGTDAPEASEAANRNSREMHTYMISPTARANAE